MTVQLKTLNEVNHQAIRLLSEQMGIVDTFRFISQFTSGQGNYTEERDALFGHLTLDDLFSEIEQLRQQPTAQGGKNGADAAKPEN